ncbi:MAG: hypothetical protein KME31_15150 [Tolypothrix carrinoi HA7290-LM1]|nr:hypothetical protein [Tolypothrix carrinoi HA7290-LM1]
MGNGFLKRGKGFWVKGKGQERRNIFPFPFPLSPFPLLSYQFPMPNQTGR